MKLVMCEYWNLHHLEKSSGRTPEITDHSLSVFGEGHSSACREFGISSGKRLQRLISLRVYL